jgi:hypothetical protein
MMHARFERVSWLQDFGLYNPVNRKKGLAFGENTNTPREWCTSRGVSTRWSKEMIEAFPVLDGDWS